MLVAQSSHRKKKRNGLRKSKTDSTKMFSSAKGRFGKRHKLVNSQSYAENVSTNTDSTLIHRFESPGVKYTAKVAEKVSDKVSEKVKDSEIDENSEAEFVNQVVLSVKAGLIAKGVKFKD